MSWLVFSLRHQQIIARKSDLNYKLLTMQRKLLDLQQYASAISDNVISLNELSQAPSSMFGRMFGFLQTSSGMAYSNAAQNIGIAMMMNGSNINAAMQNVPQQNQAQYQQYYQQLIFKNLYEQGRDKASKSETARLNQEEKQIDLQVSQIQSELTALAAEEKNVSDAESKAAESSAPKYVA
jgi:hypothetical protein